MKLLLFYLILFSGILKIHGQNFYYLHTVQEINLSFQNANWNTVLNILYQDGNDERLQASVEINGTSYDSVGVRYKGENTYHPDYPKNPINIELDYQKNQNYKGFTTIKLSNIKNDPSFVREVLGFEISRKYIVSPQSNYAWIRINESDYGLFTNTENIDGNFVNNYLNARTDDPRFKCTPIDTDGNSNLVFLGTDSTLYYSNYEIKSTYGWADFVNLLFAISEESAGIDTILDIDKLIWMMAFNNVFVNLESYLGPVSQNFYLVKDKNGRFQPIIWDLDDCFGGFDRINLSDIPDSNLEGLKNMSLFLREGNSNWPLLNLIYNNSSYRKKYVAHCKTMLEEQLVTGIPFSSGGFLQENIEVLVNFDPNSYYTSTEMFDNIENTFQFSDSLDFAAGINNLMEARKNYLLSLPEMNYSAPAISELGLSPLVLNPGTPFTITAKVENASSVTIGIRNNYREKFLLIAMYDDGLHGDGAAGDLVYGFQFTPENSDLQYYIYAENSLAGIFSPARAEKEYHTAGISGDIVINEVMASNRSTAADYNGDYDDWIELYNNSGSSKSLSGYYLTDNPDSLTKWQFPNVNIDAGEYLIVWADKDTLQYGVHTNFKLKSSGEKLLLVNPSGQIIYEMAYPPLYPDVAFARLPNGTGGFIIKAPTFNENNDNVISVEKLTENQNHIIFPNPASNYFSISSKESVSICVFSITGTKIFSKLSLQPGEQIYVNNWKQGLYIVSINGSNYKLIKN